MKKEFLTEEIIKEFVYRRQKLDYSNIRAIHFLRSLGHKISMEQAKLISKEYNILNHKNKNNSIYYHQQGRDLRDIIPNSKYGRANDRRNNKDQAWTLQEKVS